MKKYNFTHSKLKECFGVASHMKDSATVFFHQITSSLNIGRISDLISARIRESEVNELQLRALLVFIYFNLFEFESNMDFGLSQNKSKIFSFECGIDSEKFGISVGFKVPEDLTFSVDGASKALSEGLIENSFYGLIHKATLFSDKITVKYHPDKKKCEIILFLALASASYEEVDGSGVELEWINLSGELVSAPAPKEYKELGDLEQESEATTDAQEESEFSQKFSAADHLKDEIIKIRSSSPDFDDMVRRFTGSDVEFDKLPPAQQLKFYIEMIKDLQLKLKNSSDQLELAQKKSTDAKSSGGMFGLLKKALPIGLPEGAEVLTLKPVKELEENARLEFEKEKSKQVALKKNNLDYSEEILKLIQTYGLYESLKSKHNELLSSKHLIEDPKVVKWLNSLFEDLFQKRQTLLDLSLTLFNSIKEEKGGAKGEEKKLLDQIKQKEEIIRSKTTALANLKEQVNQLNINSERLKNSNKSIMADASFKKKYELQEKILENTKKDVARLRTKIDELTKEVNQYKQSSRSQNNASSGSSVEELKNLKQELQKVNKENQDLLGKVKSGERSLEPLNRQIKEAKSQMQKASQMLSTKKKEIEDMKAKNLQLEREKNKLSSDLEALKKQGNKPGSSEAA